MKINFAQELKKLDGAKLERVTETCPTCGRPKESQTMTLRSVCTDALMNTMQGERAEGEEKAKWYEMAIRITGEDVVELSLAEAALVQKRVGKMFSPLIVGQAWKMLEQKEEE